MSEAFTEIGYTLIISLMKIIAASNNSHKVEEFRRLFPRWKIVSPQEAGMSFTCEETETNYYGNALLKAQALHSTTGSLVLADDSGLEVEALNGSPGVYSARFGEVESGRSLTSQEQNALLLEKMSGVGNRKAYFVCCLVLLQTPQQFTIVQETCHGVIAASPSGGGGFGYDPLFFIESLGKTMAELTPEEKDLYSHRGYAAKTLRNLLSEPV